MAQASFVFTTTSVARQTIISDFVTGGEINLEATGTQTFTLNSDGTATVVSNFRGEDFSIPTSADPLAYKLRNTTFDGTINGNLVTFSVRFELEIDDIRSSDFNGVVFETRQEGIFQANMIGNSFPVNTVFKDRTSVNDSVNVFLGGEVIGTSSQRTVTITGVVPEPGTIAIFASLVGMFGVGRKRFRRKGSAA